MKLIVALALISFVAFAYAGVIGPTLEEYLELDSDTNSEGGVRDARNPWFGHHWNHGGGFGWGAHIGGHIGWGGYGGWGNRGGYGGWGNRGYGYGGW